MNVVGSSRFSNLRGYVPLQVSEKTMSQAPHTHTHECTAQHTLFSRGTNADADADADRRRRRRRHTRQVGEHSNEALADGLFCNDLLLDEEGNKLANKLALPLTSVHSLHQALFDKLHVDTRLGIALCIELLHTEFSLVVVVDTEVLAHDSAHLVLAFLVQLLALLFLFRALRTSHCQLWSACLLEWCFCAGAS